MDAMCQYCGTGQRIKNQIHHFIHERDYMMKKTK